MNDKRQAVEVTDDNFELTVIAASHEAPVVIDFWAEWCQPCKQLEPTLHKMQEEFAGGFVLGKINIDEQPELATEAGVRSIPTVLVFRKGMVVDQFMGVQPESVVRDIITRNLFHESDKLMAQAANSAAEGDWPQAVTLAKRAVELEPNRGDLQFELATYLIPAGELEKAESTLDALPREIRESADTEILRARIDMARIMIDAPGRQALEKSVAGNPADSLLRYQLAAAYLAEGAAEKALDNLLALVRKDRAFRDDAGRKGMLAIFAELDPEDPLIQRYRQQMFNALH